jgi:hypothetical protein
MTRRSERVNMHRFRFNIAGLIVLILICGIAFAALKESNDPWEHGVFSLALLALVTSVLLAIHRTGARRAFWLGFALFGGCYVGFSLIPPIESRLVSSQALSYIHSKLPRQSAPALSLTVIASGTSVLNIQPQPVTLTVNSDHFRLIQWGSSTENFVRIGHSLLALLLAWLGALLSRRLSRTATLAEGASQVESDED